MKKWLSVSMTLVFLISILAACSGNTNTNGNTATNAAAGENSGKKNESDAKPVELNLSIWGDENRKKLYEDLMAKYTETHPNVKVDVMLIPFNDYQQKLSIMSASKSGPDLVWLSERMVPQFLDSGQLLDISSLEADAEYDLKDIYPTTMDLFRKDSKLYGVSFTSGPKVLFFNKDMFKAKGLKTPLELAKEGKWTYEEFVKSAKTLTDSSKGVYGVHLFGANNSWKSWTDGLVDTFWAHGADVFNEDGSKFVLNSPEGEQALKLYYDLLFTDKSHVDPGNQLTFESGNIGMYRNNFSFSNNARKITNFDWDIAPMPKGPAADAPSAVGIAGYAIMKDTAHPEETLELLKYLTGKQGSTDLAKSFAPIRKSILESDVFLNIDPKPSVEAIKAAYIGPLNSGVRPQPLHQNWQQIDVKVQTLMDLMYTKTETPKQVLERMEKEVSPLLK
ncbi:hypothetical protein SY83_01075 [Paenibacillus swuensis]|uniref:Sugar ABC transporter substrate-binding protein n=1 Tax=Paenibacillus swuensis TaxID=1178515 RepID=A0A172TDP8_9BACL|nr:sugar ABC transporter substrate-binding protein [Paenibacillus swuensis]ANE45159.1 hypothetical protein SY83_01075 [Paenibacillus swuensis]